MLKSAAGWVAVMLAGVVALVWLFSGHDRLDEVSRSAPVTGADDVQAGADEVAESAIAIIDPGMPAARPVRPNLVTHVDRTALWELPAAEREDYFPQLRALADAGWAEAALAIAPRAELCVLTAAMDEVMVHYLHHPKSGFFGFSRLETAEERQAALPERMAQLEVRLEQRRQDRQTCDVVLGDDPDVIMDWLEHALVQQPPGFFRALIEDRIVPFSPGWVVRNAERLAIFNQGFLDALTARVERGDREVLAIAWKAWAGRRFLPEPDAERAWTYGLAARRLPPPWNQHAPDDAQLAEIAGADFGPRQRQAVRQSADDLWRRCCG